MWVRPRRGLRAALAMWQGCVSAVSHTRPNHSPVSLQRPVCWGHPTVPRSRSFFLSLSGSRPSWSRCCCCCFLLLLLPTTSVLKRREMLGTSIAAVVLGCFYFCPLDCDASVMVVDCAAVETGCMLEKNMKRLQRNTCSLYFLVYVMSWWVGGSLRTCSFYFLV